MFTWLGCCDTGAAPPSDRELLLRPEPPGEQHVVRPPFAAAEKAKKNGQRKALLSECPAPDCHHTRQSTAITSPNTLRHTLSVGINYYGTSGELAGCINDVHKMQSFLLQRGWQSTPNCMRVLTDDARQPQLQPTRANMIAAMRWLVAGAAPGDVLFFHFSGHGGQQLDTHGDEEDGMDETVSAPGRSSAAHRSRRARP